MLQIQGKSVTPVLKIQNLEEKNLSASNYATALMQLHRISTQPETVVFDHILFFFSSQSLCPKLPLYQRFRKAQL